MWQDAERELQKSCRGWHRRYSDLYAWLDEKKEHQSEFAARTKPFKDKFEELIKKYGGFGLNISGNALGAGEAAQPGAESKSSQGPQKEKIEPPSTGQQSQGAETKSHHTSTDPMWKKLTS